MRLIALRSPAARKPGAYVPVRPCDTCVAPMATRAKHASRPCGAALKGVRRRCTQPSKGAATENPGGRAGLARLARRRRANTWTYERRGQAENRLGRPVPLSHLAVVVPVLVPNRGDATHNCVGHPKYHLI
jgi:hypothetical protein